MGNLTSDTDYKCQLIAKEHCIEYKGSTLGKKISDGCWHAALGDYTILELQLLIKQFDCVLFLNQSASTELLDYQTNMIKTLHANQDRTLIKLPNDTMLFVGCSHTAGVGHTNPSTTYTNILANKLKLLADIQGHPGKCNAVIEDKLAEYSLQHGQIVVQFTDIFRMRYFDSISGTVKHIVGPEYSRYETEMFTEERLSYEFKKTVERVVARLRDSNARFIFFQLTHPNGQIHKLENFMAEFKEYCWTPDVTVDFAEDNLHFGIQSHKLIANRLYDHWIKLYA